MRPVAGPCALWLERWEGPVAGLGPLVAVCREEGLVAVVRAQDGAAWERRVEAWGTSRRARAQGREVAAWLDAYGAGDAPDPADAPVAWDLLGGSGFASWVWRRLAGQPWGTWTTYGELARERAAACGRPSSARAVGQAVGANPVPVVVPCHRVLAAGGRMGGFAWGARAKAALLAHEGIVPVP